MISEYESKALAFLKRNKIVFSYKFVKYDKYFPDDKDKRDIYLIALTNKERSYTFTFGNSVVQSGEYILYPSLERVHLPIGSNGKAIKNIKGFGMLNNGNSKKNLEFKEPTAYDVLACLQKNEVGEFKDFCADFGYSDDSIRALDTYEKVKYEWDNVQKLFSDEQLEELREIQ